MFDEISEIVAQALNCSKDTLSFDSGLSTHEKWDSLGQVKVMISLEKKYNIIIDETNVMNFTSIGKIIAYLKEKQNE